MSSCDVEPVECYTRRDPVSRGVVKCNDCRQIIPKGVKYRAEKWLYDGQWASNACCPECDAVVAWLINHGAECLYRGQLREYLGETSPHDYRKGGYYDGLPRTSRVVSEFLATLARDWELDPVTLEPISGSAS